MLRSSFLLLCLIMTGTASGSQQGSYPFQPGDRIEVNKDGKGKWYPAEFLRKSSTRRGYYAVFYDDSPNKRDYTKREYVRVQEASLLRYKDGTASGSSKGPQETTCMRYKEGTWYPVEKFDFPESTKRGTEIKMEYYLPCKCNGTGQVPGTLSSVYVTKTCPDFRFHGECSRKCGNLTLGCFGRCSSCAALWKDNGGGRMWKEELRKITDTRYCEECHCIAVLPPQGEETFPEKQGCPKCTGKGVMDWSMHKSNDWSMRKSKWLLKNADLPPPAKVVRLTWTGKNGRRGN